MSYDHDFVQRTLIHSFSCIVAYLESARKSAADANYHTTDEDTLGRGKRVHIANSRYSSDEESEKSVHRTSKSMYYKDMCLLYLNFLSIA